MNRHDSLHLMWLQRGTGKRYDDTACPLVTALQAGIFRALKGPLRGRTAATQTQSPARCWFYGSGDSSRKQVIAVLHACTTCGSTAVSSTRMSRPHHCVPWQHGSKTTVPAYHLVAVSHPTLLMCLGTGKLVGECEIENLHLVSCLKQLQTLKSPSRTCAAAAPATRPYRPPAPRRSCAAEPATPTAAPPPAAHCLRLRHPPGQRPAPQPARRRTPQRGATCSSRSWAAPRTRGSRTCGPCT